MQQVASKEPSRFVRKPRCESKPQLPLSRRLRRGVKLLALWHFVTPPLVDVRPSLRRMHLTVVVMCSVIVNRSAQVPSQTETDRWVERLQGPQPERDAAIEELRQIIVRGLHTSLAGKYGGAVQADDVAQEAILRILANLDRFDGRSRFTTWAMTIATRIGISELRRKHYQNVSLDQITSDDSLNIVADHDPAAVPEDRHDRDIVLARLGELIDTTLSDKQKLAIRGVLEGLPVEEVARRVDSNRNAVYKLIHDARLKLRAGLESAGIAGSDIGELFT